MALGGTTMKKPLKWVMLVVISLMILVACMAMGYVNGIYTGTARGLMIAAAGIIPTAHAIHLKPTPAVVSGLDRKIENLALELKPLERRLGRRDTQSLGDLKSLLKRYSQDHPEAIRNPEVVEWLRS